MSQEKIKIEVKRVKKGDFLSRQYNAGIYFPQHCPEDGVVIKANTSSIYLRDSDLKKMLEMTEETFEPESWDPKKRTLNLR